MKLFLNAVNKTHDTRNRLWDTEVRMERTADEYHRAILLGADLPPMPIIEVTLWHNDADPYCGGWPDDDFFGSSAFAWSSKLRI
jgi:hypothetical protein